MCLRAADQDQQSNDEPSIHERMKWMQIVSMDLETVFIPQTALKEIQVQFIIVRHCRHKRARVNHYGNN